MKRVATNLNEKFHSESYTSIRFRSHWTQLQSKLNYFKHLYFNILKLEPSRGKRSMEQRKTRSIKPDQQLCEYCNKPNHRVRMPHKSKSRENNKKMMEDGDECNKWEWKRGNRNIRQRHGYPGTRRQRWEVIKNLVERCPINSLKMNPYIQRGGYGRKGKWLRHELPKSNKQLRIFRRAY